MEALFALIALPAFGVAIACNASTGDGIAWIVAAQTSTTFHSFHWIAIVSFLAQLTVITGMTLTAICANVFGR